MTPDIDVDADLNKRARRAIETSEKAIAEFNRVLREAQETLKTRNDDGQPAESD
jgi:chromosome condensin MukBEF complex kleisin-like MukF subunit